MAFLSTISSKVGEQKPFVVIYTTLDYTGKRGLVTRCWVKGGAGPGGGLFTRTVGAGGLLARR